MLNGAESCCFPAADSGSFLKIGVCYVLRQKLLMTSTNDVFGVNEDDRVNASIKGMKDISESEPPVALQCVGAQACTHIFMLRACVTHMHACIHAFTRALKFHHKKRKHTHTHTQHQWTHACANWKRNVVQKMQHSPHHAPRFAHSFPLHRPHPPPLHTHTHTQKYAHIHITTP